MSVVEEFTEANDAYAAQFAKGPLPMPSGRRVAVVTCMDARLDPAKMLGLEEGDAHVIRNAGGRAAEALRSLAISEQLCATEIVLIHHTDCGMLTFTNTDLRDKVKNELGADASGIDFLPFSDLRQSVLDDLEIIRSSPLIPKSIKSPPRPSRGGREPEVGALLATPNSPYRISILPLPASGGVGGGV